MASFDQWKLVDRFITRNQRGIAITKLHDEGVKREFLFDLSQTYGKEFVEPNFELTKNEQHEVISRFYQDTFGENEGLEPYAFEEIISKGVSSFIKRDPTGVVKEHQLFIENSILYSLNNRLSWMRDYRTILDDLDFSFKAAEIDIIGKVSNEVTKHALIRISKLKEIVQEHEIEEEIKNEQRKDGSGELGASRSENQRQTGTRRAPNELWENGAELSRNSQPDAGSDNDGRRNLNGLSSSEEDWAMEQEIKIYKELNQKNRLPETTNIQVVEKHNQRLLSQAKELVTDQLIKSLPTNPMDFKSDPFSN